MKFGDDGDYDDSDLSPLHRALIEDYVLGHATQDDVRRALDDVGEDEGAFWDEFREKYDPYSTGDGGAIPEFLERIGRAPEHTPGIYFDLPTTTGDDTDDDGDQPERRDVQRSGVLPGEQKAGPKKKKKVSRPSVPRRRRRGDNAEEKPSTVVRVVRSVGRSIGRFFGFGGNK